MKALEHATNQTNLCADGLTNLFVEVVEICRQKELTLKLRK